MLDATLGRQLAATLSEEHHRLARDFLARQKRTHLTERTPSAIGFDGQVAIVTGAGGGLGSQHRAGTRPARRCHTGQRLRWGHAGWRGESRAGRGSSRRNPCVGWTRSRRRHARSARRLRHGRSSPMRSRHSGASTSWSTMRALPVRRHSRKRPTRTLHWNLRTNLLGPYALMRAVWDTMRAQGYGRILNVSSNAALGIGHNTSYATAKAGLIGLTLDAACEGKAPRNLRQRGDARRLHAPDRGDS